MNNIKKSTGKSQEFSTKKISDSIKKAGAKDGVADSVANDINFKDGMTTGQVRKDVLIKLQPKDSSSADKYSKFKKVN